MNTKLQTNKNPMMIMMIMIMIIMSFTYIQPKFENLTKKETPQKDNESDSEVVVPRKGGKENRYNSEKEGIDFINPSCKVMKHDPHEPRFCKSGFIK